MFTLGDRIKELREQKNIQQKEVAELISVTPRQAQRYEKNESDMPLSKAIILADYFNVNLDYLAGRSEDPKRY